ncbi:MAG: DUF2336 domain-containing protein [Xanthobacteraceae bacterium]
MPDTGLPDSSDIDAKSHSLIDELIGTVAAGSVNQRLRMLQRITDLFVAGSRGYSSQQIALFDDVLQRLAADIEVKARAKLAQRLASVEGAPPKLIRRFAFDDEIEVARPVLVHSVQLSDADLVENATSKSQEHLFAIAQRLKLSEAVTDVLVERGDDRVVRRVVRNDGARFSLAGYDRLTTRARFDDKMTLLLGRRSDIPRQYFLKLLETASASVRAKLEAANPQAVAAVRDTIDDVATAMQRETREASREYSNAVRNGKRRFRADPVTEANVHAPAHAQEFERTVVALTRLGRFPVDLVERALLDEGEEMILILAKAADCSWTTVRELLLMYVAERRLEPEHLTRAFDRYCKLSRETARKVVDFYGRRMKLRAQRNAQAGNAGAQDAPKQASSGTVSAGVPLVSCVAARAGVRA